jgi:hypothetical protein
LPVAVEVETITPTVMLQEVMAVEEREESLQHPGPPTLAEEVEVAQLDLRLILQEEVEAQVL